VAKHRAIKKTIVTTFTWTAPVASLAPIPLAAQNVSPVAPGAAQPKAAVNSAYPMFRGDTSGKNADYIPYLAQVNSKLFGIAVVTTDNQSYTIGDVNYSFSIQSISKVFTKRWPWKNSGLRQCSVELVTNRPVVPLILLMRLWTCLLTQETRWSTQAQ